MTTLRKQKVKAGFTGKSHSLNKARRGMHTYGSAALRYVVACVSVTSCIVMAKKLVCYPRGLVDFRKKEG